MRAYIIGNATIDESFTVYSLPQPGESIKATCVDRCLGGKGANQAVILARCGVATTFITATANDPRGKDIQKLLDREPLTTQYIQTSAPVSDQSILLSQRDGENVVISTTACVEQLNFKSLAPMLDSAQAEDSLILQGNMNFEVTQELLLLAKESGMRTIFNPSPVQRDFSKLWHLVSILFLNATEALAFTGKTGSAAACALLEKGNGTVVLTQGGAGAWLASDDTVKHISAKTVPTIDTSGAGDTFMSVVVGSADLRSTAVDALALQHGHRAAAITIGRHGTVSAFPTDSEITALLSKTCDAQNSK